MMFLVVLLNFISVVLCNNEQLMKIYTRLNINEESVDLSDLTSSKGAIIAYYKDKCTFYCSTIDRSINNDYDDFDAPFDGIERIGSNEDDEDEIESENIRFEWYINNKNMEWNQNNCVLDYDDIVKTQHVSTLNVTCKVIDGEQSFTYQFPKIFLDIHSMGHLKSDFEFLKAKYEQPVKIASIGFIICILATINVVLLAYWVRRKEELSLEESEID